MPLFSFTLLPTSANSAQLINDAEALQLVALRALDQDVLGVESIKVEKPDRRSMYASAFR